ncbi:unnamed protein product [Adineta steineri]|uniref:Uncharacterized protein n=1 Tax=Adineta steineri TaxID=433720 RepID=A0A814NLW3_9BILA|nr:unnamed protein product [Adineta steineri]CAF4074912.1 unnamed protein product [Adineta steineri]
MPNPNKIFLVEADSHEFRFESPVKGLHEMRSLRWPNTVQLTLSIQQSSEIMLLFRRNALPAIEHLNITNEEIRTCSSLQQHTSVSNIRLLDKDLFLMLDDCRLRSLLIRYISLGDVVTIIGLLKMPLLEKLTLIDMHDNTLDHLSKFQEICCSTHLPALKALHFSLCFPETLEHAWRNSSVGYSGEWPFDNLNYYIEDILIFTDGALHRIKKTFFVVYRSPVSVILQHKRTLHNNGFPLHVPTPINTVQRRYMEWTCDEVNKNDQLDNTLRMIASGPVDRLKLTYLYQQTNMPTIPSDIADGNLSLNYLHSLNFNFESMPIQSSQRVAIVQHLLNASPNVSHLAVAWEDFRNMSHTYSNLRHIHLLLDHVLYPQPKEYIDIYRLTQLTPNIRRFETSGGNIMFNENTIEFVLNLIRRFRQLVTLTLNKGTYYQSKEKQKIMFLESLIAAGNGKLFDINNIQIKLYSCNVLHIWL